MPDRGSGRRPDRGQSKKEEKQKLQRRRVRLGLREAKPGIRGLQNLTIKGVRKGSSAGPTLLITAPRGEQEKEKRQEVQIDVEGKPEGPRSNHSSSLMAHRDLVVGSGGAKGQK